MEDDQPSLPPGTPGTQKYEGPWFITQLTLALSIGLFSFVVFSYARRKWPLLFAPRTKLKAFSPVEAHAHSSWFGWIMPTITTSEYTILQVVGLDAAVLLHFFKMSFKLFLCLTAYAMLVIMPINFKKNSSFFPPDDDDDNKNNDGLTYLIRVLHYFDEPKPTPVPTAPADDDWLSLLTDSTSLLSLHLLSTYLFTVLTLRFLYNNYTRYIRARQLYALELVHSIPARTVLIEGLPTHLRNERALAVWWERMGLGVESVGVVRDLGGLKSLIEKRTSTMIKLENTWVKYVGNPSNVEAYDPVTAPLVDLEDGESSHISNRLNSNGPSHSQPRSLVVPANPRPTHRPSMTSGKVDSISHYTSLFNNYDAAVRSMRQKGRFPPAKAGAAFVTFEDMKSAQIAAQVISAGLSEMNDGGAGLGGMKTELAPEPRDVVWSNMTIDPWSLIIRRILSLAAFIGVTFLWIPPISLLATFLSYEELKRVLPEMFIKIIDSNERIRAVVQHSLPSLGVVILNAVVPLILELVGYMEGVKGRSWIETGVMKRYFSFLLINVLFIFLFVSSYWQVARDLYEAPGKIPEKLATALNRGTSRNYFVCYVILQALGIMPLQLLNLGVVVPRIFYRLFITRTPRDFAELNAPPMINYGAVYPQCVLVFVITLLYSINQPLILIFGTIYFGVAYVVYKYKLLFVFYKPYESHGQAWPTIFVRLMWGVIIFQVFMAGILLLREYFYLALSILPLMAGTIWWGWYIHEKRFKGLSHFVSLSSVCEVQRGAETSDGAWLKTGHPVTRSQSNLNRRRYAENDDTLYVAPEDERTDYSQPPMSNWYYGVLNTGKRRYGHPALTGVLPKPWLPLKKGQTLANRPWRKRNMDGEDANSGESALVLTLRRRTSVGKRRSRNILNALNGGGPAAELNPWSETLPIGSGVGQEPSYNTFTSSSSSGSNNKRLNHRMSWDPASGVMVLPEDETWLDDAAQEGSESEDDYGSSESPGSSPRVGDDEHRSNLDIEAQSQPQPQPQTKPQPQPPEEIAESPIIEDPRERTISQSSITPRKRHATYFHHPEKRGSIRQGMPGEFPRS